MGTVHHIPQPAWWRGDAAFHPCGQCAWDGNNAFYPSRQIAWLNGHAFYPNGRIAYRHERVWAQDHEPGDPPIWTRADAIAAEEAHGSDNLKHRMWIDLGHEIQMLVSIQGIALYVYRRRVYTNYFNRPGIHFRRIGD